MTRRVYELAKELNIDSKVLISRLEKYGITVKSHSSTLKDAYVEKIRKELQSGEQPEMVEQRIKPNVIKKISKEQFHDTTKDLTELINTNPLDAELYVQRGDVYISIGHPKNAIKDYNQAIKINPEFAKAYYCRAAALILLGARSKAMTDIEKGLALEFEHQEPDEDLRPKP